MVGVFDGIDFATGFPFTGIGSSGGVNSLAKWVGTQVVGNSLISDTGSLVSFGASVLPQTDNLFDVGSQSLRWRNGIFATQVSAGNAIFHSPSVGAVALIARTVSSASSINLLDARMVHLRTGGILQSNNTASLFKLIYARIGAGGSVQFAAESDDETESVILTAFDRAQNRMEIGADQPILKEIVYFADSNGGLGTGNTRVEFDLNRVEFDQVPRLFNTVIRRLVFDTDTNDSDSDTIAGSLRRNSRLTQSIILNESVGAGGFALGRAVRSQVSQTANDTRNNSAAENNFGSTYAVVANAMSVGVGTGAGRTIRLTASGIVSSDSVTPGNLTLRVKFGTVVLASTGPLALTAGLNSAGWLLQANIVCRTTSTGVQNGTVDVQGWALVNGTPVNMQNGSPINVNTQVSNVLAASEQFDTADPDNSIQQRQFVAEYIR